MVNAQPPPIKKAGYPMNLGHDNVGWIAACGNVLRLVFEAGSREAIVGSPAIGSNRCSRAHSRLNERNKALGGYVLNTRTRTRMRTSTRTRTRTRARTKHKTTPTHNVQRVDLHSERGHE